MEGTPKIVERLLVVFGMAAVVYHLISTQYLLLDTTGHLSAHLFFVLTLVFLNAFRQKARVWIIVLIYAAGLVAVGYVFTCREALEMRYGFPTALDTVMGIILIVVVLEATRRGMELVISLIAVFFILYAFFGHYLPPVVRSYKTDFDLLSHQLALDGVYGSLLSVSANYVFLFIVFGGVLEASGIARLFREVSALVGRALKSGPAMVSVVGELIIGGPLAAPSASIGISGSYTIPMMMKAGYSPEQAAAIEAAGGTGAQLSPPIMGASIYIMANITGIPLATLLLAGILPTFLYFFSVGTYAHLQAQKMGVRPLLGEKVNWRELALESRLFVVPIGVIMALLIKGFTPAYAIFWTIMATVFMGLLRPQTRPGLNQWLDGFTRGAIMGARVGISLAALGLVVKVLTMTGLAVRLPDMVATLSGGNFLIALVLVAIVTLILGCGMPTPAAYLVVAMTSAPVLIKLYGIAPLQVHYFVFYYAVMAMVTPPVGPSAFVAAAIAKTTYMRVVVEQVKPAIVGFVMPIAFLWLPVILLKPENIYTEVPMMFAVCIATLFIQITFVGYFFRLTSVWERALFAISGGVILSGMVMQSLLLAGVGVLPGVALGFYQKLRKRREARRDSLNKSGLSASR